MVSQLRVVAGTNCSIKADLESRELFCARLQMISYVWVRIDFVEKLERL